MVLDFPRKFLRFSLDKRLKVQFTSKMAENEQVVNGEEDTQDKKLQKKASKHDSGAGELERVTDYAEEKEIISDISTVSRQTGVFLLFSNTLWC